MNVLPMELARKPPRAKSKPPAPAARTAPKVSAKTARRVKLQCYSAGLLAGVASVMTVVSLTHVADGVQLVTHGAVPDWQAWLLAIGLDVNYIAMELAAIVAATATVKDKLHRLTRWGIPSVMSFSMALNAIEFCTKAVDSFDVAKGVVGGVVLPLFVFLTFRMAAVLADV